MSIKALKCPHCAAPLPVSGGKSVVCTFCDHVLVDLPDLWWSRPIDVPPWKGRPEDHGKRRVGVGRHTYVLREKIAQGAHADVYLGRRDARLTEQVVVKVAHDADAARALDQEWRALARLHESTARGSAHFVQLLPQPVACGALRIDRPDAAWGAVYRWRNGFRHTLRTVRERHPKGIDPRVAVWMWKRMLEMITWVHRSGFMHGALRPEHCLVYPKAHGVVLVGWSEARWRHASAATPARPAEDIRSSARVLVHVLGGDAARMPAALGRLLRSEAERPHDDAWSVRERLVRVAADVFGPPRYTPFSLDEG